MKKILLSFYLIILSFTMNAQLTFITDPNPSAVTQSSNADGYIKFGDYVYFSAFDGIRKNVYKTDGSSSGTEACIPDLYFAKATIINNKLYFLGIQQDTLKGLFLSDGTPEGTQCLYRCSYSDKNLFVNGADIYFTVVYDGKNQICSYNIDQNTAKIYPGSHTLTSESTAFSFKNDFYFFDYATVNEYLLLKTNPSEAKLDTVLYTPILGSIMKNYYYTIYNDSIRVFYRKDLDLWLTSTLGTKETNKTSMLISNADMLSVPVLYDDSITFIGNNSSINGINQNLTLYKVKPFSGYKKTKIANYGSFFEYKNCLIDGKLLFLPSQSMSSDIFVCSNSSIIKGTLNKSSFSPFYLSLSHLGKNGDYDYFAYSNLIIKIDLNTASSEVIENIPPSGYTEKAQLNGDLFYTKKANNDIEPWHFNFGNLVQEKFADINTIKVSPNISSFTNFNNAYYFNSGKLTENLLWYPSINKLSKEGNISTLWENKENQYGGITGVFNNKLLFSSGNGKFLLYTDDTKVDTIKGVTDIIGTQFGSVSFTNDRLFFYMLTDERYQSLCNLDSDFALTTGEKRDYYSNSFLTTTSAKAFYNKDSIPAGSSTKLQYLASTDGTPNNKTYIKAFDQIYSLHALPSWSNVLIETPSSQSNYCSYYFNDETPDKVELIGTYKGRINSAVKYKKQCIFAISSDTVNYLFSGGTLGSTMFLRDHTLKAFDEINDNLFLSIFSQKTKKNSLVYKPATSNNYTTIKNFNDSVITSMCSTADSLYFLVKHSENTYDLWRMDATTFSVRKIETLNLGDKILPKLMAVEGTKAFLLCTSDEYGEALYYYTFTPPTTPPTTHIGEKETSTSIKIGPNPVENYITIESPVAIRNVEISDIAGRTVDQIKNINTNQYNVIFSNRKAGVYFVKIELNDGSNMIKKIVKN